MQESRAKMLGEGAGLPSARLKVGCCRQRKGHAFDKEKCLFRTGPLRFLIPPDSSPLGLRPGLAVPLVPVEEPCRAVCMDHLLHA